VIREANTQVIYSAKIYNDFYGSLGHGAHMGYVPRLAFEVQLVFAHPRVGNMLLNK